LTREPELRRTEKGTAVLSFSLAVRNDFKNADGNYDSVFLDFVAFDVKAEVIAKYAHKGDRIAIAGKCAPRFYENKEGKKVRVDEIKVNDFEFLEARKENNSTGNFEPVDIPDAALPF
jgi:single-strand DNA-binding protein